VVHARRTVHSGVQQTRRLTEVHRRLSGLSEECVGRRSVIGECVCVCESAGELCEVGELGPHGVVFVCQLPVFILHLLQFEARILLPRGLQGRRSVGEAVPTTTMFLWYVRIGHLIEVGVRIISVAGDQSARYPANEG